MWFVDRLSWVKRLALQGVRSLGRWVPGVEAERPVSLLTKDLFKLLREALALHPAEFYGDKNFPTLLDVVERFLVYVAEEDGHYAGWLAQAMLLVHDLVDESRQGFEPGARGDVDWLVWASGHPIGDSKQGKVG